MKKNITGIVLLVLSSVASAGSFDIQLPMASNLVPGNLDKGEWSVAFHFTREADDFRLQFEPKTEEEQFLSEYSSFSPEIGLYFNYGLTEKIEIGLGGEKGRSLFLKYDLSGEVNSNHIQSLAFAYLESEVFGHAGAKISGGDDCGFFDYFCFFFGNHDPDVYEFDYRGDIRGLMVNYLYGYRFGLRVNAFVSASYTDYSIDYSLVDNTSAGQDQNHHLKTDLIALSIGTMIAVGSKGNKHFVASYKVYEDSTVHNGDFRSRVQFGVVMRY